MCALSAMSGILGIALCEYALYREIFKGKLYAIPANIDIILSPTLILEFAKLWIALLKGYKIDKNNHSKEGIKNNKSASS